MLNIIILALYIIVTVCTVCTYGRVQTKSGVVATSAGLYDWVSLLCTVLSRLFLLPCWRRLLQDNDAAAPNNITETCSMLWTGWTTMLIDQPVWLLGYAIGHCSLTSGCVDVSQLFFRNSCSPHHCSLLPRLRISGSTGLSAALDDLVWMQSVAWLERLSLVWSILQLGNAFRNQRHLLILSLT